MQTLIVEIHAKTVTQYKPRRSVERFHRSLPQTRKVRWTSWRECRSSLNPDVNNGIIYREAEVLPHHNYDGCEGIWEERVRTSSATYRSNETQDVRAKQKAHHWFKHHGYAIQTFSNNKIWTRDLTWNSRNSHLLTFFVDEFPQIIKTKHPEMAILLGNLATNG
ncbi:unnamed protein product [Lepeophtheirus salmonis]|uniref:(salmon louse) hypothetical protein n=1 Tax=Lepeophtheirus salmonis TaxID=72036 RepID=A0A7R8CXF4_LEPSM|nr:unnamed protein product [Lepeophtheirus salmonis]CAF2960605.1 unnamed protein product [Lepeophtheirus salmonis]